MYISSCASDAPVCWVNVEAKNIGVPYIDVHMHTNRGSIFLSMSIAEADKLHDKLGQALVDQFAKEEKHNAGA